MSILTPGKFATYIQNRQEAISGGALTIAQRELIHNDRTLIADSILALTFNPLNPQDFVQQDAHLKGQLSVYDFILARDEESQKLINSGEILTS